jgi:hypothetical protein
VRRVRRLRLRAASAPGAVTLQPECTRVPVYCTVAT